MINNHNAIIKCLIPFNKPFIRGDFYSFAIDNEKWLDEASPYFTHTDDLKNIRFTTQQLLHISLLNRYKTTKNIYISKLAHPHNDPQSQFDIQRFYNNRDKIARQQGSSLILFMFSLFCETQNLKVLNIYPSDNDIIFRDHDNRCSHREYYHYARGSHYNVIICHDFLRWDKLIKVDYPNALVVTEVG